MAQGSKTRNDKKNPSNTAEMWKTMSQLPTGSLAPEAVQRQLRKNIETLTTVNAVAAEALKSIGQLQTQFLKQAFDDVSKDMRACATPGAHETQAFPLKNRTKQWGEHNSKIAGEWAQSNLKIFSAFQNLAKETMDELKKFSPKA